MADEPAYPARGLLRGDNEDLWGAFGEDIPVNGPNRRRPATLDVPFRLRRIKAVLDVTCVPDRLVIRGVRQLDPVEQAAAEAMGQGVQSLFQRNLPISVISLSSSGRGIISLPHALARLRTARTGQRAGGEGSGRTRLGSPQPRRPRRDAPVFVDRLLKLDLFANDRPDGTVEGLLSWNW